MLTVRYPAFLAVLVVSILFLPCATVFAQEVVEEVDVTAEPAPSDTPAADTNATAADTDTAATDTAPAADKPETRTLEDYWRDMLHYIKVARPDLAKVNADEILKIGKPMELYLLSVNTPDAQAALIRGANLDGLKESISAIQKMIEEGYQAQRSNPEFIAEAIDLLGKSVRGYAIGVERLRSSGEYALPQLIQRLRNPQTPQMLREKIITVLPQLADNVDVTEIAGIVRGLTAALQTNDPQLQEVLASTLGRIGYPQAAPFLKELAERKGTLERTRKIATGALIRVAGANSANKSVADLFYENAMKYYNGAESILPDPRNETANVWYWENGLGLTYKAVPRAIFCDIYAMRMAKNTLAHDKQFSPAVSLWIAADLRRAAHLPAGAADPTRPADQPSAQFYALAAGAGYLQDVLAIGLEDNDSVVAMGAIEALSKTAGSQNLLPPTVAGGINPLVEATTSPDREVRFLAAYTLANALPNKPFTGSDRVLSVLNEALRQRGVKVALLLVDDPNKRNVYKDALRGDGFEVIDEPNPDRAFAAARKAVAIDVAVLDEQPDPLKQIAAMRSETAFALTPVVVAAQSASLSRLAKKDSHLVLISPDAKGPAVVEATNKALAGSAGTVLSPQRAQEWAIRAADIIRKLGETGNTIYDIRRTRIRLIEALSAKAPELQIAAIDALAVIRQAEAQQAIARLAVSESPSEGVRKAAFAALSRSLIRFGNQLNNTDAQAILDLVASPDQPKVIREAGAQALGAMNLPSDQIMTLILESNKK